MTSPLPQLGSTPSFTDALAFYNSGDIKTAKPLLEALLESEPLNVEIPVALGMCEWQLNQFKVAEETLKSFGDCAKSRRCPQRAWNGVPRYLPVEGRV